MKKKIKFKKFVKTMDRYTTDSECDFHIFTPDSKLCEAAKKTITIDDIKKCSKDEKYKKLLKMRVDSFSIYCEQDFPVVYIHLV